MDWRTSFDRTARSLLLREPFYGHLVVGMVKESADDGAFLVRLAPAALQVVLEVSPSRWLDASEAVRRSALRHELVHLALRHPLRAADHPRTEVWGMACDLVVNQLVDTAHLDAPLRVEDFAGLPRDRSADVYYQALLPLYDDLLACRQCPGGEAMARWCEAHCRGNGQGSHGRWKDFRDLGSGHRSLLDSNVEQLLLATTRRACRKGWGPLPAALIAALRALGQPPELPWRRLLRLFIAATGRTAVRNTIQRPSRRYGTVPGTKVRRRHKLIIALDTSGSISDDELATFFGEVHAAWRRGVTVHIVEADAAVARDYAYIGVTPRAVGGRGGTAFDPAIAWANDQAADGLVYFTDGFAPAPTVAPRCPMLWVVTADGDPGGLPGRVVRLTS